MNNRGPSRKPQGLKSYEIMKKFSLNPVSYFGVLWEHIKFRNRWMKIWQTIEIVVPTKYFEICF